MGGCHLVSPASIYFGGNVLLKLLACLCIMKKQQCVSAFWLIVCLVIRQCKKKTDLLFDFLLDVDFYVCLSITFFSSRVDFVSICS